MVPFGASRAFWARIPIMVEVARNGKRQQRRIGGAPLRDKNLSRVLTYVHQQSGATRADLTKRLGLNRSTIAELIVALSDAGWVDEVVDATRVGVGRPSPRVIPSRSKVVAAVNPELDAVNVALVTLGGHVLRTSRTPVDALDVETSRRVTVGAVSELLETEPSSSLMSIGVAVPGLVRESDGVVRLAPHSEWHDEPVASSLAEQLRVPVSVANDAQLGARAESIFGAGVGAATILYLNGGPSGIGGGIVSRGSIFSGASGYAGEFGHMSVDPDGPRCACGATGCLETLATRDSLVRMLKLERPDDDELEQAVLEARRDPARANEIRAEVSRQLSMLGIALRGAVNLINPDRIILGGHLAALLAASSEADRKNLLREALAVSVEATEVTVAALQSNRLLIGAAELAWQKHLASPL